MIAELDDAFWNDLLARIGEGEVVPVVGRGAVTFGSSDELLYPWLAQRLPTDLDPPLTFEKPPRDLQEVVDVQRAKSQPIERITSISTESLKTPICAPGLRLPRSPP
jgi:hypothetical protein